MEPWRPAKGEWCRISFSNLTGRNPKHGDGLFGLILDASKRTDSFVNDGGKVSVLAHITPGDVWKILTSDGLVHHWHESHLRPLEKKRTKGSESS